jgi:protein-disulfide isomerase
LHPWTSYVIVPLFALANAGTHISVDILRHAATSPITLGIIVGYVVGKPAGILAASWLATRPRLGGLRLPVGWATLFGGGAIAGIGFTVSLLIATLAFHGAELEEAKLGVLTAALVASVATWSVARAVQMLPKRVRLRAVLGSAEPIVDLAVPVDPERDHIRGPEKAKVTILEYGDFECPYCGQAEPILREVLADFGDVRYVWRNLPLNDVHPHAQTASEAAEVAGEQGKFWEMHDLLFNHQDALKVSDLIGYARQLGLDVERFADDLRRHEGAGRVAEDVDSADLSIVSGTPTFFVNGRRHQGAYDVASLSAAVKLERARAALAASQKPRR